MPAPFLPVGCTWNGARYELGPVTKVVKLDASSAYGKIGKSEAGLAETPPRAAE